METILIVLVGAVVAVLLVGIARLIYDEDRKAHDLRGRAAERPSRWSDPRLRQSPAHTEQEARPKAVAAFIPKPLPSVDAARFSDKWRIVQKRFVSEPRTAIADADRLAGEVMRARGYGRMASKQSDSLEEHPVIGVNYRRAHQISQANELGSAGTEDLRQALVHYRALFAELLDSEERVLTHA